MKNHLIEKKTVLITGAGNGIGLELVKSFLTNESFTVIATSRNVNQLLQISNPQLIVINGDLLSDYNFIINEIKKSSASINILINNAALVINKLIEDIKDEDITAVIDTNFTIPYKLIRDLIPCFNPGSHIVNISSMSGFQGSKKFKGLSLYSASKAALSSLSECLAEEFKNQNISCNCLALGAIDTNMIQISIPSLKPSILPSQIANYIYHFSLNGNQYFNGQVLPVTITTL